MKLFSGAAAVCLAFVGVSVFAADDAKPPAEKAIAGPHGMSIVVRMQGPYDADVALQAVCYFKHKAEGDKTSGAPVELDKRLHGAITALRNRGEFVGDELETILLTSPAGTIKPRALLLVGLGEEGSLSLETMERVGRVVAREAARLGAKQVAFAPLLRDQGNDKLGVGDVETAVIRGAMLAYETDKRLQQEGLAKDYTISEWVVEAGPAFYNETITGVEHGLAQAAKIAAERPTAPYAQTTK